MGALRPGARKGHTSVKLRHLISDTEAGISERNGVIWTVADQTRIGKMGRVTGTISPGKLGEVMIAVRGGSEAFHA